MQNGIDRFSACEMMQLAAAGALSVREIAEAHLQRIAQREPLVRAWQHLDTAYVVAEAQRLDALPKSERGTLHGLLVGIKDVFDTANMPTTYGSPAYRGNQPAADASVVSILRSKGALIVGKTVSTEFAAWPPSVTRNPREPGHTPGGSSSGSAAAVADCMIPVALGTQTLGSVLRPASFCGIVGFKPSYGRISCAGLKPAAESLDTVGILARHVKDADRIYRALSDCDAVSLEMPGKSLPIAYCPSLNWRHANEDARTAADTFVRSARDAGLQIDEIELPAAFRDLETVAKTIHEFEFRRDLAFERLDRMDSCSTSLKTGIRAMTRWTAHEYEAAVKAAIECRARFDGLMRPYTALLTLSATGEAPAGNETTGDPIMNSVWTLLYASCISIPVLHGRSGLPIGLQIVAPRFADNKVLQLASRLAEPP